MRSPRPRRSSGDTRPGAPLRAAAALVGLAASFVAGGARADEPLSPPVELRHDLRIDVPVTGGLLAGVVAWRLVRDDLEPSRCRWCDGASPDEANAVDVWFRDALRRPDTHPANVASYALAYGVAPLGAAGLTALAAVVDRRPSGALVDLLAVAEGALVAIGVTQLVEPVVLRTRPYVLAIADEDAREAEIAKTGAFHSFPSGHVTAAFGVAAASGVVASMRGYRLAPLVWASGLMLGAATAYTRMASDRHYFTDTLAGAAIGVVAGGGVPLLFHRPVERDPWRASGVSGLRIMTAPVRGGQVLGVSGVF